MAKPSRGAADSNHFLNLEGPKEDRQITATAEQWSEFKLSDGNSIRVKPFLVAVRRFKGQTTPDGKPAYEMQIGFVALTDVGTAAPKRKRKAAKKARHK